MIMIKFVLITAASASGGHVASAGGPLIVPSRGTCEIEIFLNNRDRLTPMGVRAMTPRGCPTAGLVGGPGSVKLYAPIMWYSVKANFVDFICDGIGRVTSWDPALRAAVPPRGTYGNVLTKQRMEMVKRFKRILAGICQQIDEMAHAAVAMAKARKAEAMARAREAEIVQHWTDTTGLVIRGNQVIDVSARKVKEVIEVTSSSQSSSSPVCRLTFAVHRRLRSIARSDADPDLGMVTDAIARSLGGACLAAPDDVEPYTGDRSPAMASASAEFNGKWSISGWFRTRTLTCETTSGKLIGKYEFRASRIPNKDTAKRFQEALSKGKKDDAFWIKACAAIGKIRNIVNDWVMEPMNDDTP